MLYEVITLELFGNLLKFAGEFRKFRLNLFQFLLSSNGTLLPNRGYLYFSAGINGYFKNREFEEGMIRSDVNYFGGLHSAGSKMVRTFIKMNYTLGLKRNNFV